MTSEVRFNVPKLPPMQIPERVQSPRPENSICGLCKKIFDNHGIKSKFCSKECSLSGCRVIKSKPKKVVNFCMVKNTMHFYDSKKNSKESSKS